MPGRLVVCPTPIGNLDDVTPRMREALVTADFIACEDTRRTGALLDRLRIRPATKASAPPSWRSGSSAATRSRSSPTPECPASPTPATS
jgi:16S rRNA C1402 (ribose-2'-O) methylase RsmI